MIEYKWFLMATLLLLLTSHIPANAQTQRPNIVFILADDLGYGDIGVNGQQFIRTPNIDRLAAQGIQFTQFYAGATVCAPSRSALLTGMHTGHTYIRGNLEVTPEGQFPIKDSVITMFEVLQQAGYKTAVYGKWGLGPVGSEGDPNRQGVGQFYGYNCQSLAHRYYPDHLWENDRMIDLEENDSFRQTKQYAADIIQENAMNFIGHQNDKNPFFLLLSYNLPHAELLVPNDSIFNYYKGRFEEKPYKGNDYGEIAAPGGYVSQDYPRATFAAMVERLDRYVGEVMEKLSQKGFDKNTLVVFTSDNGPHREGGADPVFFNSGGGFRGTKRDLYEGGIRVPFMVRWSGKIKPGTTSNHIGAFWDLFPTFAELAGVKKIPHTDGITIFPSLVNKTVQQKHSYLYWEFHEEGGKQAVREDNWKAVRLQVDSFPNGPVELYDLSNDPAEKINLANKYPAKAKQLMERMDAAHTRSTLFPFLYEQ